MSLLTADNMQAQTLRFLIVGCGAAAGFTLGTWALIKLGVQPPLAAAVAYFLSFCFAYTLQRCWTFKVSDGHSRTLPRYIATQITCAVLAMITAHIASSWLGLAPLASAIVTTIVSSGTGFVLTSRWVFA